MVTRNSNGSLLKKAAIAATAAVCVITLAHPSLAASTSKAPTVEAPAAAVKATSDDITDFSSQRRRYARGGGYGGAAAAAAVAGIVGTAIIASQANRGYGYGNPYDSYAYGGGPGYYGGGGYYGNPGYYGRSTGYYNGNGGVPLFKGRPLASW